MINRHEFLTAAKALELLVSEHVKAIAVRRDFFGVMG